MSVRKAPGYKEQVRVSIEGEVVYPGSYAIVSNQEKLSDLLKRAGGIKEGGYATGAFLLRKTFENLDKQQHCPYICENLIDNMSKSKSKN